MLAKDRAHGFFQDVADIPTPILVAYRDDHGELRLYNLNPEAAALWQFTARALVATADKYCLPPSLLKADMDGKYFRTARDQPLRTLFGPASVAGLQALQAESKPAIQLLRLNHQFGSRIIRSRVYSYDWGLWIEFLPAKVPRPPADLAQKIEELAQAADSSQKLISILISILIALGTGFYPLIEYLQIHRLAPPKRERTAPGRESSRS